MATIKPNWTLPVHTKKTCSICGGKIKPVAYMDDEGFCLAGWDCDKLDNDIDDLDEFDWPFVEQFATAFDLESAGFLIV